MTTETRTYTPLEYADQLRVSVRTIYRQIHAGTIKAERIGRQFRIVRYVVVRSPPSPPSAGG